MKYYILHSGLTIRVVCIMVSAKARFNFEAMCIRELKWDLSFLI